MNEKLLIARLFPTYRFRVPKTEIGVKRRVTINDMYNAFLYLRNQPYYSGIIPKYVNVEAVSERITDTIRLRRRPKIKASERITDIMNLRGMSETREYRNLPIDDKKDSLIYFESRNGSCAGRIEPTYSTIIGKNPLNAMILVAEAGAAAILVYKGVTEMSVLPYIGGIFFGCDLKTKIMPSHKDAILVTVGFNASVEKPSQQEVDALEKIVLGKKTSFEYRAALSSIDNFEEDSYSAKLMATNFIEDNSRFEKLVKHVRKMKV